MTLPAQFRNQVVHGDVMETLRALPDASVDMIFGDPDYGVGINYAGRKFVQKWDEYIGWYVGLARECVRVLREDGNLFLMNYPKQNAHLRALYLDGAAYDVFDYSWVYPTNVGHSPRRFTTAHRSILHAVKSKHNRFYGEQVAQPYKNPEDRRIQQRIAEGHKGRMPYSWFEFNLVKNVSREKTFHACQIPAELFEMLVNASTQPGDSVFTLFGGSGSEIVRLQDMGRIFLSCEIHPEYHRMILDRLKNGGAIRDEFRLPCALKAQKRGRSRIPSRPAVAGARRGLL